MRMKVVNYHAVAERLAPKVAELTGSKPKEGTLVVAIKRVSDRMQELRSDELETVLSGASVTLTGGIVETTIMLRGVQPGRILGEVAGRFARLSATPEVLLLPDTLKLLTLNDDAELIRMELGRGYDIRLETGLAKIGVRLDQKAQALPGIATFITELLFRNGITLRSAYVGRPETLFVVEEKFGARTYDVLRLTAIGQ